MEGLGPSTGSGEPRVQGAPSHVLEGLDPLTGSEEPRAIERPNPIATTHEELNEEPTDTPMYDISPENTSMDVDQRPEEEEMEENLPQVTPRAKSPGRVPLWQQELAASTAERVRTTTPYQLREKPTKKTL